MISNISFGSTYKVNNKANDYDSFVQFQRFAFNKEMKNGVGIKFKDNMDSKYPNNYFAQYTMIAPDSIDDEIELYCACKGIKFTKLSNDELLEPNNILSRIQQPKDGMTKVYISSIKLEKLAETQQTNIDRCESDYNKYYSEKVDNNIKSGDEIPATTLVIQSNNSADDTVDYIRKYGSDRLNPNQLYVGFHRTTDDADHCTYFALRDREIDNIPVYVDDNTYDMANALGLLED